MIHKLVAWPIRALILLGEKVEEEVNRELYDIPHLQQQLISLHMMFEMEEIDEETYLRKETELLTRFQIAKQREWEAMRGDEDA
ncbi:gas vesicle protein GvpG [Brevibacillus dissolubilis]|uniref:gas vesicle protein GvpG n=1 Tax=Brevibacillus dissolubilis TaxID=1844116 RepID=UPI001116A808|nr:gas vesicle protein GvpG [Brevibacillus dissolubilis]